MTCSIKICGVTGTDDAQMVSEAGIDYLGVLVNVSQSPRAVSIEKAAEIIAASHVPVIVLTYDHGIEDVLRVVKALQPAGVQLAGTENELYISALRDAIGGEIWKTVHLPQAGTEKNISAVLAAQINRLSDIGINRVVLDTAVSRGSVDLRGGTGEQCDWSIAAHIKQQVDMFLFLAGGIGPGNVRDALLQVHPDGIDLSSGVELVKGKKDAALLHRLVAAATEPMSHTS